MNPNWPKLNRKHAFDRQTVADVFTINRIRPLSHQEVGLAYNSEFANPDAKCSRAVWVYTSSAAFFFCALSRTCSLLLLVFPTLELVLIIINIIKAN